MENKTTTTYEARGHAYAQEDSYEHGCSFDGCATDREWRLGVVIKADTLEECLEACAESCGADMESLTDVYAEADLDRGRFDFQTMEDDAGLHASDDEEALWKAGDFRLWLVDYSFQIQRVTREEAIR